MPLERIDSYFNGAVESYDERLKRSAEDEDGYIRRTAEFFPKKEHLHILDIGNCRAEPDDLCGWH